MNTGASHALPNEREEAYAVERSFGYRPRIAARRAGLDPYTGIGGKYEAKPRVQARIAFLRSQDLTPEMLAAKRRQLEERLELAAYGNIFEFTDIADGSPQIDWRRVVTSDLSVAINEFVFDKDTGKLTKFKRDDALAAIAQLRDMHGFRSASKVALTDPSGEHPMEISDSHRAIALAEFIERVKREGSQNETEAQQHHDPAPAK